MAPKSRRSTLVTNVVNDSSATFGSVAQEPNAYSPSWLPPPLVNNDTKRTRRTARQKRLAKIRKEKLRVKMFGKQAKLVLRMIDMSPELLNRIMHWLPCSFKVLVIEVDGDHTGVIFGEDGWKRMGFGTDTDGERTHYIPKSWIYEKKRSDVYSRVKFTATELLGHIFEHAERDAELKACLTTNQTSLQDLLLPPTIASIFENSAYRFAADFPTSSQPDVSPIPFLLQQHLGNIKTIHITIDVGVRRKDNYCTQLFAAQDQIQNLLQYAPQTKSVTIELVGEAIGKHEMPRRYRARTRDVMKGKAYTSLEEEAGRLVDSMERSEVDSKMIAYREKTSDDLWDRVPWLRYCADESQEYEVLDGSTQEKGERIVGGQQRIFIVE